MSSLVEAEASHTGLIGMNNFMTYSLCSSPLSGPALILNPARACPCSHLDKSLKSPGLEDGCHNTLPWSPVAALLWVSVSGCSSSCSGSSEALWGFRFGFGGRTILLLGSPKLNRVRPGWLLDGVTSKENSCRRCDGDSRGGSVPSLRVELLSPEPESAELAEMTTSKDQGRTENQCLFIFFARA